VERFKALMQALSAAWLWFAGALVCGALCVLFSVTVGVPARVISVLPCSYSLGRYQSVPGSAALVQTADGHYHYTLCREGQPFSVGHETQLERSLFGGDPFPALYPLLALGIGGVLAFIGAGRVSQQRKWWERLRKKGARRHHQRHQRQGQQARQPRRKK
jgi:hypothetical protein